MSLIERTFPLAFGEINVTFDWDRGDPSVGIGEGWGEETGAEVRVGPVCTVFVFEPEDDTAVCQWKVNEIQTLYEQQHDREAVRERAVYHVDRRHGYTMEFAPSPDQHREEYDREVERLLERPKPRKLLAEAVDQITLGDVPEVCVAVQQVWEESLFQRRLEAIGEDGWSTEAYIADLEAQLDPELQGPPATEERRQEIERTLAEQRAHLAAVRAEAARLEAEYLERYRTDRGHALHGSERAQQGGTQ